jgi:RNA polymerase sigma-70 factor (ECF subfamily)
MRAQPDPDIAHLEDDLEDLPCDLREVLALREIDGLSYRESADMVGVPIGTVKSRLAYARERLRRMDRRACRTGQEPDRAAATE